MQSKVANFVECFETVELWNSFAQLPIGKSVCEFYRSNIVLLYSIVCVFHMFHSSTQKERRTFPQKKLSDSPTEKGISKHTAEICCGTFVEQNTQNVELHWKKVVCAAWIIPFSL